MDRILQIINAGVRIQGVIIADDTRTTNSPHTPTKPVVSLPSARTVFSLIGKAMLGLVVIACIAMLGLTFVAGAVVLAPLLILSAGLGYDPALIILVDDGNGGTAWVSVFTWFD